MKLALAGIFLLAIFVIGFSQVSTSPTPVPEPPKAALPDLKDFELIFQTKTIAYYVNFKAAVADGATVKFYGIAGPYVVIESTMMVDPSRSKLSEFKADCSRMTVRELTSRYVLSDEVTVVKDGEIPFEKDSAIDRAIKKICVAKLGPSA